jgi:hypothetical protein
MSDDFKRLILPGMDTRLFDRRQEEEDQSAALNREFGERYSMGAPELPEAQLVFSPNGGIGVAIKGARYVCRLPKGYSAQGLEIGLIDGGRYIVKHPNHPPLLLDPQSGGTRSL